MQAWQPIQCNASPTNEAHYFYVSAWMVGYSVGGSPGCDISFSASWSSDGFDVEHITCGTFPSLSEGVGLQASAFIDSVVHATCDACHSMLTTPVGAYWSCRALGF